MNLSLLKDVAVPVPRKVSQRGKRTTLHLRHVVTTCSSGQKRCVFPPKFENLNIHHFEQTSPHLQLPTHGDARALTQATESVPVLKERQAAKKSSRPLHQLKTRLLCQPTKTLSCSHPSVIDQAPLITGRDFAITNCFPYTSPTAVA